MDLIANGCKEGYYLFFPSSSPNFGDAVQDATFYCQYQSDYCKENHKQCKPAIKGKTLSYLCIRGQLIPSNPCKPGFKYVSVYGNTGIISAYACHKNGAPAPNDGFLDLGEICPENFNSVYPKGKISCSIDKPCETEDDCKQFFNYQNCVNEGGFQWDDNEKTKDCCQQFGGTINSFSYSCWAENIEYPPESVPSDVCATPAVTFDASAYGAGMGSACCFLP